jgi:putative oxidoreductase
VSDANAIDFALIVFRCGIAAIVIAHGINHIFGGGKTEGTARWFGSMGMRWPLAQAWIASLTEIVAGALLALGLLTPFGGAAVVGVMVVAWAINHRGNGFFVFRPGEGWEYVLALGLCGMVLGAVGPGSWSLDEVFDVRDRLDGLAGLLIAVVGGIGGAAALLAVAWRPRMSDSSTSTE